MHKIIQLISNFFDYNNMVFSMKVYVQYMNSMKTKLYKNFKIFKFWRKGLQGKGILKNHLIKKKLFNGFKMSSLKCNHMCKKTFCQKTCLVIHWNLFLEFLDFCIFGYKSKYSYTIMYECENSPLPHKLS
jgi:hypothetical protein